MALMFIDSVMYLKLEEIPEKEPTLGADFSIHSNQPNQSRKSVVTCVSQGIVHHPGDTWISDNWFTKKCMPDGSIIILNCIVNNNTTMKINTQLRLGKMTYKCYRNRTDSSVYFEMSIE
ncbi:hypothetical protein DICVIV_04749 [Dictyocaulus viviparus]|uniref:Abnormal cell migration protein 18-like fibronectin type I domain-containing protein n=1 Tax=Dictyocaulus viviparus TaxID=29172 RepID=A0A0D8XZC0_DICVI|nr:hypothetical protein DICVIV_04749 [Dictyocaulus viviparus]